MEFYAKNSMYQLLSPIEVLQKLQIYYVTESWVATIKGAQYTGRDVDSLDKNTLLPWTIDGFVTHCQKFFNILEINSEKQH